MRSKRLTLLTWLMAVLLLCCPAFAEEAEKPAAPATLGTKRITLSLTNQGAEHSGNSWKLTTSSKSPTLHLSWKSTEIAHYYEIAVDDGKANELVKTTTTSMSASVSLPEGTVDTTVTVYVIGRDEMDQHVYSASISVNIRYQPGQSDELPGADVGNGGMEGDGGQDDQGGQGSQGMPSIPGGWGSWGGRRPSGSGQSVGITAGKALTTSHADGTHDLTPYNMIAIKPGEEPMTQLALDGHSLAVQLDDGQAAFVAEADSDAVILTPVADGSSWQVRGDTLALLRRSGVASLILKLNDETLSIPTDYQPEGVLYTRLRAEGHASADFLWRLTASGVTVTVDGETYTLHENRLQAEEE